MSLKISLYSPERFDSDDDVEIIFEVTNTSSGNIDILKWFTPLEGLRSSCLFIKAGRKIIRYDGIKVKRAQPKVGSFMRIGPGESISCKINLEEAYLLPSSGNVKIEFDPNGLVATNLEDLGSEKDIYSFAIRHQIKKINSVGCTFRLDRAGKKILTLGMKMRADKADGSKNKDTAKDPKVQGMSTAEETKIKAAHLKGYSLATGALSALANDAKYKKWFGAHTVARFGEVKRVFGKIKTGLETLQYTYINNGPNCELDDIAYTTDGSDKVFICKSFWGLTAIGEDSQAGTIVHEHSHTSGTTNDHEYGIDGCMQLAKDNPDKAIDNGDSYQFYSET